VGIADPPGPLNIHIALVSGPNSEYSLELYDSECLLLQDDSEAVSYTMEDTAGVADEKDFYLKVVYVSGDPCEPWELTILTGFPNFVEQETEEHSNDDIENAETVGFFCPIPECNPELLIDGVLYDIVGGLGSDYYLFPLPIDTELTIRTLPSQYQSENVDTIISLYDDVGTLIASNDGSPYDIIKEPLFTGMYYIRVTAFESAGDGHYRLSLTLGLPP
jgi:hypothetical protein